MKRPPDSQRRTETGQARRARSAARRRASRCAVSVGPRDASGARFSSPGCGRPWSSNTRSSIRRPPAATPGTAACATPVRASCGDGKKQVGGEEQHRHEQRSFVDQAGETDQAAAAPVAGGCATGFWLAGFGLGCACRRAVLLLLGQAVVLLPLAPNLLAALRRHLLAACDSVPAPARAPLGSEPPIAACATAAAPAPRASCSGNAW